MARDQKMNGSGVEGPAEMQRGVQHQLKYVKMGAGTVLQSLHASNMCCQWTDKDGNQD